MSLEQTERQSPTTLVSAKENCKYTLPRAAPPPLPTSSCGTGGRRPCVGSIASRADEHYSLDENITHQRSKADAAYTETAEPGRDGRAAFVAGAITAGSRSSSA